MVSIFFCTFVEKLEGMELEELQSRLEHLHHLESRENGPETPQKAYLTMEDSEKNRYIEFLIQQKEERDRTIAD